ncbi:MAG: hypothetical protein JSV88_25955 [Candidatus Aminicenantes bacterium]|nr:MAG: hypothetical protein JSV88_25955 [Candidatus Aminicenantes bacterium]
MKNKKFFYFGYFVVFIAGLSIFSAIFFNCSGKSEEDLIRETIDKIGDYAESRNMEGIIYYVSDDYSDDEDRTVEDIEELLGKYFSQYRGIAVNVLGTKILNVTVPAAEVETEVALSSGAAKIFRKAVRYAGQFYRFNLKLVKEEEIWKCKSASWKYITLEELFPESCKILKKLFPNAF